MLSSLVDGLRSRYRRQMIKQTKEMEPHIRTQLVEYVQDGLIDATEVVDEGDGSDSNQQQEQPRLTAVDSDTIQNELDIAHENISKLQSKEEFIAVRLNKYKQVPQDKLTDEQKQQLLKVDGIHKDMIQQIQVLENRVAELEYQQSLIRMQKEECEDFLNIAHDIEIERQRQRMGLITDTELLPIDSEEDVAAAAAAEASGKDNETDNNVSHENDNDDKDGNIELGKSSGATGAVDGAAAVKDVESFSESDEKKNETTTTDADDQGDDYLNANQNDDNENDQHAGEDDVEQHVGAQQQAADN